MCKDCKTGKYKFSFMEMITSGCDGSTSATGFVGVILCLICMLMALAIFFFYVFNVGEAEHLLEFLDKVIIMLGIGSALLGARKISGAITNRNSVADVIKTVEDVIASKEEEEDRIVRRRMSYNPSNNHSVPNSEEPTVD